MASSKDYLEYILDQLSGLDDVENREFLCDLLDAMYPELPAPKKRKK